MTRHTDTPIRGNHFRIVAATRPSQRADFILASLAGRGIPVSAILLDRGKLRGRSKFTRVHQVWRGRGAVETLRRVRRRLRRAVRAAGGAVKDRYVKYAPTRWVDDLNGGVSTTFLRELRPDLLVLGSCRVLKPHVLAIPRLGTLNAHPGLLPEYRGVDMVARAVLNGDPLGVTVHFVDEGIDTGAIVARRGLDVRPGDDLAALTRRADALAGELMAEVVGRIVGGEPLHPIPQEPGSGHLYPRMTPAEKQRAEELLRRRRAADRPLVGSRSGRLIG